MEAAVADFLNTATLSKVVVEDAHGTPIENFAIETVSDVPVGAHGVFIFKDGFETALEPWFVD